MKKWISALCLCLLACEQKAEPKVANFIVGQDTLYQADWKLYSQNFPLLDSKEINPQLVYTLKKEWLLNQVLLHEVAKHTSYSKAWNSQKKALQASHFQKDRIGKRLGIAPSKFEGEEKPEIFAKRNILEKADLNAFFEEHKSKFSGDFTSNQKQVQRAYLQKHRADLFRRVSKELQKKWVLKAFANPDTLVVYSDKSISSKMDWEQFLEEVPAAIRPSIPPKVLQERFLEREVFYREAQEQEFFLSAPKLLQEELSFARVFYMDSVAIVDSLTQVSFLEKYPSMKGANAKDIRLAILAGDEALKGVRATLADMPLQITNNGLLLQNEYLRGETIHLWNKVGVKSMDSSFAWNPLAADSFWNSPEVKSRNLEVMWDAFYGLKNLEKRDSLHYLLGQSLVDSKRFHEAVAVFKRFEDVFETSVLLDRVLFLHGFVYSENLKEDSNAVDLFARVLKEYPKSELADDADYMIRDIRSGHKLSENFLKALENGSLDSLKKSL